MNCVTYPTIRVEHHPHHGWEVGLPDPEEPVTCRTLQEAQRVAYRLATRRQPCEIVIHDAYHRVARRELVSPH